MSPISSAELASWENKGLDDWFGPASLTSEATSFFDLGFDYGQDVFHSSDASVEFNFFDDIDVGSTSTDASVFSSTTDRLSSTTSNSNSNVSSHRSFHDPSARPLRNAVIAPVSLSQKLVHRLRPEGLAISSADLLSIEGRVHHHTLVNRTVQRPKTPPTTPQYHSGLNTPKTPRTPKERGSKVQKPSMYSPKKAMYPSNYYASPDTPSMQEWSERFQRLKYQPNGDLPLSPPPSSRIPQNAQCTPQQQSTSIPEFPIQSASMTARRVSTAAPTPLSQPMYESIEQDAAEMSPFDTWPDAGNMSFSPISPIFQEATWTTDNNVQLQNTQPEQTYIDSTSDIAISQSFGGSGLLIDFGDDHTLSNPFPESYSLEQAVSIPIPSPSHEAVAQWPLQSPLRADPYAHHRAASADSTTSNALTSRSPTPSPKSQHRPTHSLRINTSSKRPNSHRRTHSAATGKSGVSKPSSKSAGRSGAQSAAPGDMFVNFTPSDSRRILTGVAPSGSSKTKARRDKEVRDRERRLSEEKRRMSEAARRAVIEAGGNWEMVTAASGELVGV